MIGQKIHIKESITCWKLLVLQKVIRGKFVTGKINKRGVFSIAVSNTKQSNTSTQSKALYPPTQSRPNTNQVLAHGLLATRAK